jgi:hypothetical protein
MNAFMSKNVLETYGKGTWYEHIKLVEREVWIRIIIVLVCTDKIPSVLKTHYIIDSNLLRLFCV